VEGSIIHVGRRLRMAASEPASAREYYLDVGKRQGLSDGEIVDIYREIPVTDQLAGGSPRLMRLPLGELKIVVAGEVTSLARLHRAASPETIPTSELALPMVGDRLRPKTRLPSTQPLP